MAREVIIRKTNDFDRTQEADETVEFTIEGVTYVVDTDQDRAEALREFLAPYMEVAHEKIKLNKAGAPAKGGGARSSTARSPEGETTAERRKIRAWANANGHKVNARGVLSNEVRMAYAQATGEDVKLNTANPDPAPEDGQLAMPGAPEASPKRERANSNGVTPAMRKWARENGHKVKQGYVTREVRDLFYEATENETETPASRHHNANHRNGALV